MDSRPPPSSARERGHQDPIPLTEEQRRIHFLNRFTLGVTPASIDELQDLGIPDWFDTQVSGAASLGRDLSRYLARMPSLGLTNREIVRRYDQPQLGSATQEQRREQQRLRNVPSSELRDSVLLSAVYSGRQLQEAAADFFRNHFCVALDKGRIRFYATEYEREVIRARVFGSFRDMLGASAKHPAMLDFLDNAVSRRPPTKAELKAIELRVRQQTRSKERGLEASSIAAQRGLNENYARELLELHTLGVDNHYRQEDVESVARILTGWTIHNSGSEALTFVFRPGMHCPEDKRVLRRVIHHDRKDPQTEGEQLLDLLAEHAGTADHLALKLCRHFVHDDPDEGIVRRVAAVFGKTKGDLPAVYRAIVDDPDFFAPRNYLAKFKRPFEFVASALRVTRAEVGECAGLHKALAAMNEDLYLCKDPTGYYDQAEAWLDPGALAIRWKFARDLVTGRIKGVRVPASLYADLAKLEPDAWTQALVHRLLPAGIGPRSAGALEALLQEHLATHARPDLESLAPLLTALILGTPEFQKQ